MAPDVGDIQWVYLYRADERDLHPGELVSADAGGLPIYRVMSLQNGRVWLRDLWNGADRISPVSDFHWKAQPAPLQ